MPLSHSLWWRIALFSATSLMLSCTTTQVQRTDSVAAILTAPGDQVQAAVIQVLTEDGYTVRHAKRSQRTLTTGYRQEINSIWDWLLRYSFGVSRSRVDATLISEEGPAEEEPATRLTIEVTYQSKDSLFSHWYRTDTPLPQSAANQVRLVKKALGLL
jgi:hypothetical protein